MIRLKIKQGLLIISIMTLIKLLTLILYYLGPVSTERMMCGVSRYLTPRFKSLLTASLFYLRAERFFRKWFMGSGPWTDVDPIGSGPYDPKGNKHVA